MKRMKFVRGLCLAGLCMGAVVAFGVSGSASAAPLLFITENGKTTYHFTGLGGESLLETVAGKKIKSTDVHILALVLSSTLVDTSLTFLKVANEFNEECQNAGAGTGTIATGLLLGHLGLADHEGIERKAILILVGKIHFFCKSPLGGTVLVLVRGSVIGEITSPALGVASELLTVKFAQNKGKQLLQSILFGSTLVTSQHQETAIDGTGGTGGVFEESGQQGEGTLQALKGEGAFLLVSP